MRTALHNLSRSTALVSSSASTSSVVGGFPSVKTLSEGGGGSFTYALSRAGFAAKNGVHPVARAGVTGLLRCGSSVGSPANPTTSRACEAGTRGNWSSGGFGVRGFHVSTPRLAASQKDYYELLGIQKGASDKEIKQAYLALAKKLHPDTNSTNPKAAEQFQEVQKAYETLKNPEQRQIYDQVGPEGMNGFNNGNGHPGFREDVDTDDIFRAFFGGGRKPSRGPDLQIRVEISFMEAMLGVNKTLNLPSDSGSLRAVSVNIPKGVDSAMKMMVQGEGGKSNNPKLPPGHLYVYVEVRPDKFFVRDGDDIHTEADVRIDQAAIGGTIRTRTLFDNEVELKLKPGTQSGHRLKLRGKGAPRLQREGSYGDHYVHVNVRVPEKLTARQLKLLEEFGREAEEAKKAAAA